LIKAEWLKCKLWKSFDYAVFLVKLTIFITMLSSFELTTTKLNLARNPEFHACIKHINIQYHFVCEAVDCHLVDFEFISIIK
jgi:hypothetical protein